ncbi:MAG: pilin [Candidatus Buchananbacteria bacterium]
MQKKLWLKIKLVTLLGVMLFILPQIVLAAPQDPLGLSRLAIYTETDLMTIILNVIRWFLSLLTFIAVLMIIYGGFLWMTSRGNQDQIDKAKQVLKNTVIGLILILSSLIIVSFIVGWWTGGWQEPAPVTPPIVDCPGCGWLGGGIIQSHYPARDQQDVSRDTKIAVTFKEKMDVNSIINCQPKTACDPDSQGIYRGTVKSNSVAITQYLDLNNPTTATTVLPEKIDAYTADSRTFMFRPQNPLGEQNQKIKEEVKLTANIEKASGDSAFVCSGTNCQNYYVWNFYTNGQLDLVPPQIIEILPIPDDLHDGVVAIIKNSSRATGSITVNSQPRTFLTTSASVAKVAANSTWPNLKINNAQNYTGNSVEVCVSTNNPVTTVAVDWGCGSTVAEDVYDNNNVAIQNDSISLGAGLSLTRAATEPAFANGQLWKVTLVKGQAADTLMIAGKTFTFVAAGGVAKSNEIKLDSNTALTAVKISQAITNDALLNSLLSSDVSGNVINLSAKPLGAAGNNFTLQTTAVGRLALQPTTGHLAGGQDEESGPTVTDVVDQPKNTIIQITFSKAIDPISLDRNLLVKQIATYVNGTPNNSVPPAEIAGKITVSNQYRTVEFVSSTECGVNSCGQAVYCLPGDAQIKVDLAAATLQSCASSADCAGGYQCSLYPTEAKKVCLKESKPYPKAATGLDGVVDMANNSLDANKNDYAQGPQSQSGLIPYNFNNTALYSSTPVTTVMGDDAVWSFWTNNQVDLVAPRVVKGVCSDGLTLCPNALGEYCATCQALSNPYYDKVVEANPGLNDQLTNLFSKLMRLATFKPGYGYTLENGKKVCQSGAKLGSICQTATDCGGQVCNNQDPYHYLTIIPRSVPAVGYWITGINLDTNQDTVKDYSQAQINQTGFKESSKYNLEIGSGLQDLRQNCFAPCAGPGCTAYSNNSIEGWVEGSENSSNKKVYPYCVLPLSIVPTSIDLPIVSQPPPVIIPTPIPPDQGGGG